MNDLKRKEDIHEPDVRVETKGKMQRNERGETKGRGK